MNGDDWKKGMQNEAESVTDARWARETRSACRQRHVLLDALLAGAGVLGFSGTWWVFWTALVNCRFGLAETPLGCWASRTPDSLDALMLVTLIVLGFHSALFQFGLLCSWELSL